MNKVIFGLSMILIVSISTLFAASYDVYYEESSSFVLPKFIFENDFIQNVILVAIPTGSAFLTSLVCVHVVPNSVHSRVNFAQTTDPNMMVIQTWCEKSG